MKSGRIVKLVIVGLLMITVLSGCSSKSPKGIAWESVTDLQEEDNRFMYEVYSDANDSKLGTSEVQVKVNKEENIIEFSSLDDINVNDGKGNIINVKQESIVTANSENMEPMTSIVKINTDGTEVDVEGAYDYEKMKVLIKAKLPDEERKGEIDLARPLLDNNQILQAIRFMPLKEKYEVLLNNVIISSAVQTPCKVVVVGKEKIEENNTTYECYHIELRLTGQVQHCWYTVEERELIKYSYPGAYMVKVS